MSQSRVILRAVALCSVLSASVVARAEGICVAPASPTAWWDGDAVGLGAADDLMSMHQGTFLGETRVGPGLVGDAFFFDGNGDEIVVADRAALDFGAGDFSVAFWVRFENLQSNINGLVDKDDFRGDVSNVRGWLFNICDSCGGLGLETRQLVNGVGAKTHARVPPSRLSTGVWHFVVGARSGRTLSLYLDGERVATATESALTDVSNDVALTIGSLGAASPQYLHGGLDEVTLWARAVTSDEVRALFLARDAGQCKPGAVQRCGDGLVQAPELCDDGGLASDDGCGPLCSTEACGDGIVQVGEACDDGNLAGNDGCSASCQTEIAVCADVSAGLTHWWRGEGDALDEIGSLDGTRLGNASFTPSGYVDGGFSFDGASDSHIDFGQPAVASSVFSLSFWIRSDGAQHIYAVPVSQGHGNNSGFAVQYGWPLGRGTSFVWGTGTIGWYTLTFDLDLESDLGWHHLVVTSDGHTVRTWRDGVARGSHSGAPVGAGAAAFQLGRDTINTDSSHRAFYGDLDEVMLWDRALTETEVRALHDADRTGLCTNEAPVARAEAFVTTVLVGDPVELDGGSSTDPDGDGLSYAWTLQGPAGGGATLAQDGTRASFVPDIAGQWVVSLRVSDGELQSEPVEVVITVEEPVTVTAPEHVAAASELVAEAPLLSFTARGHLQAVLNALREAADAMASGDLLSAIAKLTQVRARADGCLPNAQAARDWIIDCALQERLAAEIDAALGAL